MPENDMNTRCIPFEFKIKNLLKYNNQKHIILIG